MAEMTAEERLFEALPFTADRLILLANDALREAAEREREQCCRDMCPRCAQGFEAIKTPAAPGQWAHLTQSRHLVTCKADAIRNRSNQ